MSYCCTYLLAFADVDARVKTNHRGVLCGVYIVRSVDIHGVGIMLPHVGRRITLVKSADQRGIVDCDRHLEQR